MKKAKQLLAIVLCVACVLTVSGLSVGAATSIRDASNSGMLGIYNSNNGQEHTNLARKDGVTFTGDDWATGDNRGLQCLNNGVLKPSAGQSEGWIINYDTAASKESVDVTMNLPIPTAVSAVAMYGSFEHQGYGMPARFQIVGTLADDSTVVLYDHSQYDYKNVATSSNAHRFNFPLTTVKAITLRCLAPATDCDGKAMPDANIAYWLTEFMAINDVEEIVAPIDVTASDNLAFLASVQTNASIYCWDRPVTDLTDNAPQSPYWGGFLLFKDHTNDVLNTRGETVDVLFQFGEPTTMNTIKVMGREASANGGVMDQYRIIGTLVDGTETVIYDTDKAADYPNVHIKPAGQDQFLEIAFPRVTVAKVKLEMWGWTDSGDGNVSMWMNEVMMYNVGGAKAVTVDKATLAMKPGDTETLTAAKDVENDQVLVWTTTDTAVATVENGVVKAVGNGECKVRVALADDPTVYAETAVSVVADIVDVTGITLNKAETTIIVNNSETLTATIAPENATTKSVTWTSSDPSVATVEDGVVRGLKVGTVTITATSTANDQAVATCTVTVEKVAVTGVTVTPATVTLNQLDTQQLKATVAPENATYQGITWESADPDAVSVDAKTGLVTAMKGGVTVKVYAVSTDDNTIKGECVVTVNDVALEGLYLFADEVCENMLEEATLEAGKTLTAYPYFDPTDATLTDLVWTSSDDKIATVKDGVVTGLKAGTVTIKAVSAADESIEASFTVTVTGELPESSEDAGSSDEPTSPDTGVAAPVAALAVLALSAGAVLATKKVRR